MRWQETNGLSLFILSMTCSLSSFMSSFLSSLFAHEDDERMRRWSREVKAMMDDSSSQSLLASLSRFFQFSLLCLPVFSAPFSSPVTSKTFTRLREEKANPQPHLLLQSSSSSFLFIHSLLTVSYFPSSARIQFNYYQVALSRQENKVTSRSDAFHGNSSEMNWKASCVHLKEHAVHTHD